MNILRSYRYYETPLFDYVGTLFIGFIITSYTTIPLTLVTIVLFCLSIIIHYIFNITTITNTYINSFWKKNLLK